MRIIFGLLIAALIIIGITNQGWPVMRAVDSAWRFIDRTDHLVRYSRGIPLRGTPDLAQLDARLAAKGLGIGADVFMRIFKKEIRARTLDEEGRWLCAVRHLSDLPLVG